MTALGFSTPDLRSRSRWRWMALAVESLLVWPLGNRDL